MSDELPDGWAYSPLRDLVCHTLGGDWGKGEEDREPDSVPVAVVRSTEFRQWQGARASGAARRYIRQSSLSKRKLLVDDLVIEVSGGGPNQPVGRALRVDAIALASSSLPLVCSNFCRQLRLDQSISATFIEHALAWIYSTGQLEPLQTQTTNLRNLNFESFLDLELPVPPLAEQRRIVAKVEALLEQVRRAKDRLDRVPLILNRFRQAVLAAACSGQLTEGWRALQRRVGTASDRLPTLEAKRRALWERRASDRGGSKRKYPEPFDPAPPDDVEIPEGWAWASVSALALLDVGFAFPSNGFKESGVRLLRGENIAPGTLRWSDTKCWPASDLAPHQHLLVEPGEIILGMDRPLVAAGLKIARAKASDLPALLVQRVMRFKMADPKDTDYLFLCLSERRFIEFLAHDGMTGSDLPHITGTGVAEFPVPLPPADEQAEIVRRVDSLFALATAIEQRVEQAAARAGSLPQAILSKAFAGELVPTEAELARAAGRDYETAGQLIERVRRTTPRPPARRSRRNGPPSTP
jgi:type I restriction enzyme, S subunit